MQTRILVAGITAALAIAGAVTAAALVGGASDGNASTAAALKQRGMHDGHGPGHAGADESHLTHGTAGDPHAQTGMDRPAFPPGQGSVPTAEQAASLEEVSSIGIFSDHDFTPANGVRAGSGTLDDPFVITGYHVTGDLYLGDTDACVLIFGNYVDGQLTLNWNAQCVHVHHNYIRDLRVNENIPRTGYATGGLIEQNKITVVGQIRHYDGEFRHNVVGPFTPSDLWDQVLETTTLIAPQFLVANVDGFNEAWFHHNTFFGSVDLDLHGHHHGTGFFAPHSHYHGDDMNKSAEARGHTEDHTDRWTSVAFTDNRIVDSEGYGLRYEDENHAGDDRTANSESTEMLEEMHQHHTMVTLARNVVEGAQIRVDIFNADDDNHATRNPGWLNITDNQVILQERQEDLELPFFTFEHVLTAGIQVSAVKELELLVARNTVTYQEAPGSAGPSSTVRDLVPFLYPQYYEEPAGIDLWYVRDGKVAVVDNTVSGFPYGVRAREMDAASNWTVTGNDFGSAQHPVWYDGSVANPPSTDEDAEAAEDPHDHGTAARQAEVGALPRSAQSVASRLSI